MDRDGPDEPAGNGLDDTGAEGPGEPEDFECLEHLEHLERDPLIAQFRHVLRAQFGTDLQGLSHRVRATQRASLMAAARARVAGGAGGDRDRAP